MEIGKFHPPRHKIDTPETIDKNSAQYITSVRGQPKPNLVQIRPLGASGQMGEIWQKYFFNTFSHTFLMDFYAR